MDEPTKYGKSEYEQQSANTDINELELSRESRRAIPAILNGVFVLNERETPITRPNLSRLGRKQSPGEQVDDQKPLKARKLSRPSKSHKRGLELTSRQREVFDWIENLIVPAMVEKYIEEKVLKPESNHG